MFAVELKVLGLRRAILDRLYWWWVYALVWHLNVPVKWYDWLGLAGWLAYFEWRDTMEYPVIGRFERMKWQQRLRQKAERRE